MRICTFIIRNFFMTFVLDHFNYYASNITRAKKFYSETLGLKVVCKGTADAFSVLISDGDFIVVLRSDVENIDGSTGASVVLRVNNLEESINNLKKKGVVIISDVDEITLCYQSTIQDSEGNYIKLIERKRKSVEPK